MVGRPWLKNSTASTRMTEEVAWFARETWKMPRSLAIGRHWERFEYPVQPLQESNKSTFLRTLWFRRLAAADRFWAPLGWRFRGPYRVPLGGWRSIRLQRASRLRDH